MPALRSSFLAATAAVALWLGLVECAVAAPPAQMTPAQTAAERCLFPALGERAKPEYPEEALRNKQGGRVDAEFTFSSPDVAPDVRFTSESPEGMLASVKAYARQLRVPCLGKGDAPVALKQTFDFVPNDGRKVAWTAPVEPANLRRKAEFECMTADSTLRPEYPASSLRDNHEGVVVARVRFTAPDKPPVVEFLDNGGDGHFVRAVSPFMDSMRSPCLQGAPLDTMFRYRFIIDGSPRPVLNDLDLRHFIATVKAVPPGSAYFDTQLMKCPFDVRITLLQPWEPNLVQELEEDVPARHAFLDWMSQREFDLPPRKTNGLLGQEMVVHIPCAIIDL
jgi:hypothetical protein